MSKFTKDSGPTWVVLIDKNPIGPFSEDEIRLKFEAGEVRPNDIAFKVDPATDKPGSEWKFLWQFMEFERRRNVALPAEPLFAGEAERRVLISEEQTRQRILSSLPQEFLHDLPTLVSDRLPPEPEIVAVDLDSKDTDITDRFVLPRRRLTIYNSIPIVSFTIFAVLLTWLFLASTMPVEIDTEKRVPANAKAPQPAKPLKKK